MKKNYVIICQEYGGGYNYTMPNFSFSRKGRAYDQLDEIIRQVRTGEYWGSTDNYPKYKLVSDENERTGNVVRRVIFKGEGTKSMMFTIHELILDSAYGL